MMNLDFECPKCSEVMKSEYKEGVASEIVATCRHHQPPLVLDLKQRPRTEAETREILGRVGAEDLLD